LVELFQDLMGDYASVAHPNTFMHQKYGDSTAQYQLAELTGVRFVGIAETKRGVELEESVVKQISRQDTISARAPSGKPFKYRPQFKLWMSTNHKPEIPDGSEAIWDRLRLIPFTQRFDGKARKADKKLPEKLREELSGILLWAVQGCVEWYQNGLGSARAVEAATAAYREETDVIDRFFADECVFGPEHTVTKKVLFEAWESWCYDNGEEPGKQTGFTRVMGERGVVRGFEEKKVKGVRIWSGIGLQSDPQPDPKRGVVKTEIEENGGENVGESAPQSAFFDKVPPTQKSCKQEGGERSRGQFSENKENFSPELLRVEGFAENGQKVPPEAQSAPQGVTTPLRWDEDGVEWEYVPVEESE
jgi:P4 family phage/plasmid primase-like protien